MSNLKIRSNLITVEKAGRTPERYIPGDLAALMFPEKIDSRVKHMYFTATQLVEMEQTLICTKCRRACAGTCVLT